MAKFWPQYRHAPDLGSSPALRVYTIHLEISELSTTRREFKANFGHTIDMYLTLASAPLDMSIRFIAKFLALH